MLKGPGSIGAFGFEEVVEGAVFAAGFDVKYVVLESKLFCFVEGKLGVQDGVREQKPHLLPDSAKKSLIMH